MKILSIVVSLFILGLALLLTWQTNPMDNIHILTTPYARHVQPLESPFAHAVNSISTEPIYPIPLNHGLNPVTVKLGEMLFNDPRLSHDNTIACVSCHGLGMGGADGLKTFKGISGSTGERNSPTVFNSGFNFRQFWDGRAATLEEQIDGPLNSPIEMGSNWEEVLEKLKHDKNYTALFNTLYEDGITADNIKQAIATFERSLTTPNSRFDRYLRGDKAILSEREKKGYFYFKTYGCVTCHQGINIGGNLYQRFGIMGNYFTSHPNTNGDDLGRYVITGQEKDRYVFKVPTLRNVALTAPYFHDGSASTLEEAVSIMGRYQLGHYLSNEEIGLITDFLRTLTGEYNGQPL